MRLIRLLLLLYPRAFRDRYGDGIAEFARQRIAEAGRGRRMRAYLRTAGDIAVSAIVERVAPSIHRHDPLRPTESQMSTIIQEFVFAARSLRKHVAFSGAAVATLALGIGATTAIFSVVESVLLRPLPFAEAERVIVPESARPATGERGPSITYADFMDWRDNRVFDKVAAYSQLQMDITGGVEPTRVAVAAVTPEFFQAIGVEAVRGRVIGSTDSPISAPHAIVISDRLWRNHFGARDDIVGLEVEVAAIRRPVVGVLPPGAAWPLDTDLWVPLRLATEQDPDLLRRDNRIYLGVARLRADRTLEGTRAEMARLAAIVERDHPGIRKGVTMVPTPVMEALLGDSTPRALWALLGAVGLLLLIGCVNVASLQLARASARQREMAVRTALGASGSRLVRQTLVESLTLAVTGAALGALVARWTVAAIVSIAPADVPRIASSAVNAQALGFTLAVSVVVALLFGLMPAVQAARSAPAGALGESGRGASGGRRGSRTRRTLVAVELALSVVLLVGAGLALRSIDRLRGVDVGFNPRPVVAASVWLPGARYDNSVKRVAFMRALSERIAAAPGVAAAGIVTASPLAAGGFYLGRRLIAEGRGAGTDGEIDANWSVATPGYFDALGTPIARGRDFTWRDDSASTPVMIVSESFAKAMFPGEDALGKRAMSSRDEKVYREVVGVVRDMKFGGPRDSTPNLVWVPYAQDVWGIGIVTVRAREGAPASSVLGAMKRELAAIDPGIALANVVTMNDARSRALAGDRLLAILLGAFAALALVLAAVGVFGVLAYMVEQRTREMGLGASRADVMTLVAREAVPMVAIGVAVGLAGAFAAARVVRSLFYGIEPNDPATYGAVALILAAIAMAAALVPARRAARVDPMVALRND